MDSLLELTIGCLIMSVVSNIIWIKFCNVDLRTRKYSIIASSLVLTALLVVNYTFISSYLKVITCTILCFFLLCIFFKTEIRESIILAFFTELIFVIAELIFSIIMIIIFGNDLELVMSEHFGSILTNLCVSIIGIIISILPASNRLYRFLLGVTKKIKLNNIIYLSLILIISINLFLAMPYYRINTLTIVIINAILLIVYSFIILKFIQEKNRYINISDKYSLTEASMKELQNNINRLKTVNHENKNQLLTIRAMIANKDKNVLKNIDAIIDRKIKDDKELRIKTSILSNTMLGSLIYSKILTMQECSIKYDVHIDKKISKIELIDMGDKTNIDICKIVGVYIDNAIEATLESKDKELYIDIFMEKNSFDITISNTFVGKITMDRISDYGYTTKSEGHGYGLSLVKEVINDNNNLSSETEIINNVFTQKLKIKM